MTDTEPAHADSHPDSNDSNALNRRSFLAGGAALGLLPSALSAQFDPRADRPLRENEADPQEPKPNEPPDLQLSMDELVKIDPDHGGTLEGFADAEIAARVDAITARPEFQLIRETLGRSVDARRAEGGELTLPPSTAGFEFRTVEAVFLPFTGAAIPVEGSGLGFTDGILSIVDQGQGVDLLVGLDVQREADGEISSTIGAWVDDDGVAQTIEVTFDNFIDFDGNIPIKLNGELAVLEVLPFDIDIDLVPDKLKKDNGELVRVKRAVCLIIACLALSQGCSWLAKLAICAEAGAAAGAAWAGTGPGAAACATVATTICAFIIGRICKWILAQAGIDAPTICDKIGIPEGAC